MFLSIYYIKDIQYIIIYNRVLYILYYIYKGQRSAGAAVRHSRTLFLPFPF